MLDSKEIDINTDSDLICGPIEISEIMQEQFRHIKGNTFQEKIDTLNKCDCCNRHQSYRPTSWCKNELMNYNRYGTTSTWFMCKEDGPEGMKKRYQNKIALCDCNCRHLARFMCRQSPQ